MPDSTTAKKLLELISSLPKRQGEPNGWEDTSLPLGLLSYLETNAYKSYVLEMEFERDSVEAFKNARWPISYSLPEDIRRRVVELDKSGKARQASKIIIGFYHRNDFQNLKQMVSRWNLHKFFIPRMEIFNDALISHCRKEYTLSVPALVPQIEGILSEIVKEYDNDMEVGYGTITKVYNSLLENPDNYFLWEIACSLHHWLETSLYAKTGLKREIQKPIHRRLVTRHTILHGYYINYNRPIVSLKQFVALDAIFSLTYWFRSDYDTL